MLKLDLAHVGPPPTPDDLMGAWNLDPVLLLGLLLTAWVYARGCRDRHQVEHWRIGCFIGALVTLVIALVSPLDALSGALASAHMVQHVLLVLVAGPLLVLSAPVAALVRGTPPAVRRAGTRSLRRLRLTRHNLRVLRDPVAVWLLHVGTLWFWHTAVLYNAALENQVVHILEHATFLTTALLFWRVVVGRAVLPRRVSPGFGILLVFAMAFQSVFLSALLTFARSPWYAAYASTTTPWGLDPLDDQQLAGVIMWVPAGVIYLGAALWLLITWIKATEQEGVPSPEADSRNLGRGLPFHPKGS